MRPLFAASVWLLATLASAQTVQVMPTGGRLLGYAAMPEVGTWIVFADGYLQVVTRSVDGGRGILWEGPPGKYGVIYLPPGTPGEVTPVIIQVALGGGEPDPDPDPDPDPQPGPNGPWQIMMFYSADQLDDMSAPQRALLTSLSLRKRFLADGHDLLEILESAAVNDAVASKYKAWLDAVKGDSLPRIAIAPIKGGKIRDYPLPANEADLLALLKKPPPESK